MIFDVTQTRLFHVSPVAECGGLISETDITRYYHGRPTKIWRCSQCGHEGVPTVENAAKPRFLPLDGTDIVLIDLDPSDPVAPGGPLIAPKDEGGEG